MGNRESKLQLECSTHTPFRDSSGYSTDSGYDTLHSHVCEGNARRTGRTKGNKLLEHTEPAGEQHRTRCKGKAISKQNALKTENIVNVNVNAVLQNLHDVQQTCSEEKLVGKYVEKGNFTAAFLTRQGGNLKIGSRVSLYVPPDALPETGVHLIYIYISSTESKRSGLKENEDWLTPVVECGPNGTQFRKKVLLSVELHQVKVCDYAPAKPIAYCDPHHAGKDDGNWEKHSSSSIHGERVIFEINHFTGFAAAGDTGAVEEGLRRSSKWIAAAAFVNGKEEGAVCVRWCNFQNYESMLKEKGAEKYLCDKNPTPSIRVDNSGRDIVVRLVKGNPENPNACDYIKFQKINCENILKNDKGEVDFQLEERINQNTFIEIFQKQSSRILLTPFMNTGSRGAKESKVSTLQEETLFLRQQPDLTPSRHTLSFMSDKGFRELCIILEGMESVAMISQGWKSLAEKCGLVQNRMVSCIEARACCQQRSPAAIVLDHFFKKYRLDRAHDAMRHLSNLLLEMGNHDAQELVDVEILGTCPDNCHDSPAEYFAEEKDISLANRKRPISRKNMRLPLDDPITAISGHDIQPAWSQRAPHDDQVACLQSQSNEEGHQEKDDHLCSCFGFYFGFQNCRQSRGDAELKRMSVKRGSTRSTRSRESGYASSLSSPSTHSAGPSLMY